jgi:nucleoside-diphosphate-sugar epimerase
MSSPQRIFVTGGAGYIGSRLVPALLEQGHHVTSFDRMFFGEGAPAQHPRLTRVNADIRDQSALERSLTAGAFDTVIHLAAVSNDPGADISADLSHQINRVALEAVMRRARDTGVKRFLYASSASVYGVKNTPDVHEDLPLEPLTRYKAEGETVLNQLVSPSFVGVSVRSATVCGWSPRLRLDLTVNIFTYQALTKEKLTVFGGTQLRPNVHVDDLVDFYLLLLDAPAAAINGQCFNVVHSNASVAQLAELARGVVKPSLTVEVSPSNDLRSYSLSGAKAERVLGYRARRELSQAVNGLCEAYRRGDVPNAEGPEYRNVEWMKRHLDAWNRSAS